MLLSRLCAFMFIEHLYNIIRRCVCVCVGLYRVYHAVRAAEGLQYDDITYLHIRR